MPVFEMQIDGKTFEVDAPDPETAAASLHAHTGKAPSMVEGVGRAAARGVPILGGALNKLDAATNAALSPIIDPLLPDSFEKLKGKDFSERYAHALELQQGKDTAFAEEHPIADAVAEIGGGIASTGVAAGTATGAKLLGLTGKTLPKMISQGAASGAAISGVDAAVRGENPVTAGAVGGVVGGVAPAAGRAIGTLAAPAIQRVQNAYRGTTNPLAEAERRVASALDRDMVAGDTGLSPREFVDAKAEGLPVNLMDAGGETTRALARSAANTSPEGRATLNRAIDERFAEQSPRLAEWLQSTFHYPNADAQQEALDKIAKTVNRPNYAKAYSEGANLKFDETFEQISQAPVVQDAIRKAMVSAKNDAAKLGFTPPKNPFAFDETGRLKLKTENGRTMEPNLQFWDIVKRNLDKTGTSEGRDWARILRDRLDEMVPSYGTARAGAARFFGAGDALEAGQNFVGASQKFGLPAARKQLAKMSAEEKQLFQDGYVSRLVETIDKNPDRRTILNKIQNSPAAREEINVALGRERAGEVEARLRVEGIMDLARPAVQGGSTTARQLHELQLAGGVGAGGIGGALLGGPAGLLSAALVYGAARGQAVIDENVAKHVAKLLTSNDVRQLQKGIRILSRNQNMMGAIRNADAGLAAIAARGADPTISRDLGAQ